MSQTFDRACANVFWARGMIGVLGFGAILSESILGRHFHWMKVGFEVISGGLGRSVAMVVEAIRGGDEQF